MLKINIKLSMMYHFEINDQTKRINVHLQFVKWTKF